jgi:hypothetical protein
MELGEMSVSAQRNLRWISFQESFFQLSHIVEQNSQAAGVAGIFTDY